MATKTELDMEGTNGATVSITGTSGTWQAGAWTTAWPTATYSTTQKRAGSTSCRFTSTAYLDFGQPPVQTAPAFVRRSYWYLDAAPTAEATLLMVFDAGGQNWRLSITTDRRLKIYRSADATTAQTTASQVPTGAFFRLETMLNLDASGGATQFEAKIWNSPESTGAATNTVTLTKSGAANADDPATVYAGVFDHLFTGAVIGSNWYLDDEAWQDGTTYLGPKIASISIDPIPSRTVVSALSVAHSLNLAPIPSRTVVSPIGVGLLPTIYDCEGPAGDRIDDEWVQEPTTGFLGGQWIINGNWLGGDGSQERHRFSSAFRHRGTTSLKVDKDTDLGGWTVPNPLPGALTHPTFSQAYIPGGFYQQAYFLFHNDYPPQDLSLFWTIPANQQAQQGFVEIEGTDLNELGLPQGTPGLVEVYSQNGNNKVDSIEPGLERWVRMAVLFDPTEKEGQTVLRVWLNPWADNDHYDLELRSPAGADTELGYVPYSPIYSIQAAWDALDPSSTAEIYYDDVTVQDRALGWPEPVGDVIYLEPIPSVTVVSALSVSEDIIRLDPIPSVTVVSGVSAVGELAITLAEIPSVTVVHEISVDIRITLAPIPSFTVVHAIRVRDVSVVTRGRMRRRNRSIGGLS